MKGVDKHDCQTRRRMLQAGAAGLSGLAIAATFPSLALDAGAGQKETKKIRYSDLLLHELRQKLDEKPLAYLPLGTLEQHGLHLALGADAIQSEALMLELAHRYGGVVFPPIHISPGPPTLNYEGPFPVRRDFWDLVYDPATNVGGDTYWIPDVLYGAVIDGCWPTVNGSAFARSSPMGMARHAESGYGN